MNIYVMTNIIKKEKISQFIDGKFTGIEIVNL